MKLNNSDPNDTNEAYKLKPVHVSKLEKWLVKKILRILGNPRIFVSLPDGSVIYVCEKKPDTGMHILAPGEQLQGEVHFRAETLGS